jgi:hypothetical protein
VTRTPARLGAQPVPRAGLLAGAVSAVLTALIRFERRMDPLFRPAFDRWLRPPIAAVVQWLLLRRAGNDGLSLAEERELPGEAEATRAIIKSMGAFLVEQYPPGQTLRAGNTKTYGVVRAEFIVRADLPERLRHGLFHNPGTYPAWVRFAGPGPFAPANIDDNGVLSIGVKVMGVAGSKLLDEEHTQDFTGISAPTFTTPDVVENAKLQRQLWAGTPVLYFVDPRDPHLLDMVMQGLWSKTHANPLAARYYSCVAYLLGGGQAMHYAFTPREPPHDGVPHRPSPDYLREAMARTLAAREMVFDVGIQLQTDPRRMPIENASVRWPERLSPFVSAAALRIPVQRFDSPAQLAFAEQLTYNPWHCLPEHRPLGSQNRARRTIYLELSGLRLCRNGLHRVEPTGAEVFE